MRRVGIVLLVALAAAGCGVRTETVPGPAAPLTGTGTTTGTPAGTTTGTTAGTPTGTTAGTTTGTPKATATSPSATPGTFRNISMTGAGLTITFPVPADWDVAHNDASGRWNTDAALGDKVLLRVDLTARGTGTAQDVAEGVEADIRPHRSGYARLGITAVDGVGDDAVDWTYRYELDGTPSRVIDRQILSGPGGIAIYLRAPVASYDRYLPVWQRVAADLEIRTS